MPEKLPWPGDDAYKDGVLSKGWMGNVINVVNLVYNIQISPPTICRVTVTKENIMFDFSASPLLQTLTLTVIANGTTTDVIFTARLA